MRSVYFYHEVDLVYINVGIAIIVKTVSWCHYSSY